MQEKKWILQQRLTRISDHQECLIYPMGAERYLASVLFGNKKGHYNIRNEIEGKDILIIPGYGNSSFLFAQAGAESITVYDKDPVTIAWLKAFKKYYNYCEYNGKGRPYPSVGEILAALTRWYPPQMSLPTGNFKNLLHLFFDPQSLRRSYFFYMLSLVQHAIKTKVPGNFELDKNILFHAGEIQQMILNKEKKVFDTAFVPYLLGVVNGVERENEIVDFIKQLTELVPKGHILVSPSRNTKEFYIFGKRYFVTTVYANIKLIPKLSAYTIDEDSRWHSTQGLAVFGLPVK